MKSILTVLVLLAFAIPAKTEDPQLAKPIVVPFETLASGHMTVMVKINGKGPYRLIFDTGAPISLFSNKVAKEGGLLKNIKKPPISLFGNMGEARVEILHVGDQEARDVAGVVMDHPTVQAIAKAFGPIEGIVGYPFFARFKMTLDYQAKTITLVPNGYKPGDVMKAMEASLMALVNNEAKFLAPAGLWGFQAGNGDEEEPGVPVKGVQAGSPAAEGGLKEGDRLLTLDGRWTDTLRDLYSAAAGVKPGTRVAVMIKREGKEMTLRIKPVQGL
jgi:hypothetical protein